MTQRTGAARGIETTSAVVEGAADGLADGIEREGLQESMPGLVHDTAPVVARNLPPRSERLRARLQHADEKVAHAIASTRDKARAVAETARRARRAPPHLIDDVREAAKAYVGGLTASIALYGVAGVLAIAAAIVFTVALVQGLTELWGRPWGALAVAALYGVFAWGAIGSAKGRAAAGRERAGEHLEEARQEVHDVVEPVRRAFGGQRPPSPPYKAPPARSAPADEALRLDDRTTLQADTVSPAPAAASGPVPPPSATGIPPATPRTAQPLDPEAPLPPPVIGPNDRM